MGAVPSLLPRKLFVSFFFLFSIAAIISGVSGILFLTFWVNVLPPLFKPFGIADAAVIATHKAATNAPHHIIYLDL
jgi:hypothetical protein